MISVDSLVYKIDQRLNKLSTNYHQSIPVEDKLLIINDSQNQLILTKLSPNNDYKLGLDAFKKRYQDLQFLIESSSDHKLSLTLDNIHLNGYSASTEDLDPKFMFYIDGYLIADKGECKDRVIYTNADLPKHADVTILLRDSNYKPSFEYQETIIEISSGELKVYSDGTFTPKELYVSYLRYPKSVRMKDIEDFQGVPTETQDCELEDYLENELLDIIVENIAIYTENNQAAQSANIKNKTNE